MKKHRNGDKKRKGRSKETIKNRNGEPPYGKVGISCYTFT